MARPITARKADLCYFLFFVIHVPVMLFIDLTPLYPRSIHSALPFLHDIRAWYITTYADRLFTHPPAYFAFYTWMEALYHLPLSLWAIGALLRDDPQVPLMLLVFAMQTALTTGTCIAEMLGWSGYSSDQRLALAQLYVPYLLLSVAMGWDCFGRLSGVVREAVRVKGEEKAR